MTTKYELTNSFVEITECGEDTDANFIIQNKGRDTVFLKFGLAATDYYELQADDTFIRAGVDGKVYCRAANGNAIIVVTGA